MAFRQGPRLGLVARMGFMGAFGVAVIAAGATFEWRRYMPTGSALAGSTDDVAARATETIPAQVEAAAPSRPKIDPETSTIEDLLAADSPSRAADVEATGSVTPSPLDKVARGTVTGLPIPRFVSLKAEKVNVRRGPSRDHDIAWVFQRAGLPVEITAEFENWRRIRDSDGAEGWVMQSMLSGRRTALVAPWSKDRTMAVYRSETEDAPVIARLEAGVLASIKECSGDWCRLEDDRFSGWIRQNDLWGAYPGEAVE